MIALMVVIAVWLWVRGALREWYAVLAMRDDLELNTRAGDVLVIMLAAWPLYRVRRRYEERRAVGR